ncbi:MAG: C4-dicarboxylic acid transporter DauA [Myxococcaceae bacterium]|nr:C4-dicarboxylic acid transporter DauA [Myxococcaceae bacterium]
MRKRYEAVLAALPEIGPRPASALREVLRAGYGARDLRADVLAGVVVGIIALPLSMALAIASGVPPQHGIYTAIVAGAATALLGGSRTQVSGPTAAFVVVLAPVSAKFGLGGLLLATVMAGLFLVALGLARMGRLLQYIPYPVTTGFTAGIAVVIATLQLKDFLGLTVREMPEHFLDKVRALVEALPTLRASDLGVGAATLAVLLLWPRITKRIPAPLVALALGAVMAALGHHLLPDLEIATIGSRFSYLLGGEVRSGIPQLPPLPVLPWTLPGANGQPLTLSFALLRELAPSALAIALLGAIESLLSAVVADGMAGTRHDPDTELVAQGVGNLLAPFFGGFAATGAIARTATNIRAGGRSPVAALVHAAFVLLTVLVLAPILAWLPMASLAALLMLVAWNMSEVQHFTHVLRVAPKSDVTVLLTCFGLTVVFDMVVGVTAGIVLAALLFMRRMAEISGARVSEGQHPTLREPLPRGVVLYEIGGPLFFGAAQKAMSTLEEIAASVWVVILDVSAVPAMDATGLVNLESALERMAQARVLVIIAGLQAQPAKVLEKAGLGPREGLLALCPTLEAAIEVARNTARRGAPATPQEPPLALPEQEPRAHQGSR